MSNTTVNRITRIVFGSALIVTTLVVKSAPLGGFAILPLVAIPLILSGVFGENPLGELIDRPVTRIKVHLEHAFSKIFKRATIAA